MPERPQQARWLILAQLSPPWIMGIAQAKPDQIWLARHVKNILPNASFPDSTDPNFHWEIFCATGLLSAGSYLIIKVRYFFCATTNSGGITMQEFKQLEQEVVTVFELTDTELMAVSGGTIVRDVPPPSK